MLLPIAFALIAKVHDTTVVLLGIVQSTVVHFRVALKSSKVFNATELPGALVIFCRITFLSLLNPLKLLNKASDDVLQIQCINATVNACIDVTGNAKALMLLLMLMHQC